MLVRPYGNLGIVELIDNTIKNVKFIGKPFENVEKLRKKTTEQKTI